MTKVERINFDFPLNKTIEIQGKDFDKLLKLNFSGQNIKVKIKEFKGFCLINKIYIYW